ncbi:MAG: hypothetical protein HY047_20785 [Acidobacteria bacterium]|nr:hypothetical protein [Acidobacteriota bacterium]
MEDLRDLCRELNQRGAKYVVVGGFAIRAANYIRSTIDVDLIVATDADNEAHVEILVDLMRSAGGIDYAEASKDVVVHDVDGVPIPFASPRLLWRMKAVTHREKDAPDLVFLRHWFAQHGEEPPSL